MSGGQDNDPAVAARQIVNYDEIWDFEPRQTTIGNQQLLGRGVPRVALVYGIVLFVVLELLARFPVMPTHYVDSLTRAALSAAFAAGLASWLWMLPPGGIKPHQAAAPMLRGLLAPTHLHGWRALPGEQHALRPAPVPIEPDFVGRWPLARYHGPGLLIRVGNARQITPEQRRRGAPVLVLEQQDGMRDTPQSLRVKERRAIELRPAEPRRPG